MAAVVIEPSQGNLKEQIEIGNHYGVDLNYAGAIQYLRTRCRWTQKLENELVSMALSGKDCPNMCEWPPEDK